MTVLGDGIQLPSELAVAPNQVFVRAFDAVVRLRTTLPFEVARIELGASPTAITSSSSGVFVATMPTTTSHRTWRLFRLDAQGGVSELATGAGGISSMAADASDVFLVEMDQGQLLSVPAQGGAAKIIAKNTGMIRDVALSRDSVYWSSAGHVMQSMMATGNPGPGAIARLEKTSGRITLLAKPLMPDSISVVGSTVYFSTVEGIHKLEGSGPPALAFWGIGKESAFTATDIAADEKAVFFSLAPTSPDARGRLMRGGPAADEAQLLAELGSSGGKLALDRNAVYVSDLAAGKVLKVTR